MADNLTLGYLADFAGGSLSSAQKSVLDRIAALKASGGGSNLNIGDLLQVQLDMSSFTILTQTVSAVVKDVGDTMKSVVRNIN